MIQSNPQNTTGITEAIELGKQRRSIAFLPFVPAGYPDLQTTVATLIELQHAGADAIEVGIPFSDPVADGPVIQEAFAHALAAKVRVADTLQAIAEARRVLTIPVLAMVSFSIVYRYGLQSFLKNAKSVGISGLILPDLPPPEGQRICAQVNDAGLDTVLLVAPTTTVERRAEIARLSTGFIYYLSVSGITGARAALPVNLTEGVRNLKQMTDRPICVGFGISKAEHLAQLRGLADGAIVGSALVKAMKAQIANGSTAVASAAGAYARELLATA